MERLAGSEEGKPLEIISRMLEEVYSKASKYGEIIGRISRYSSVEMGEKGLLEVEVEPEIYYSNKNSPVHRIGEYLVVVEPKTGRLVLLRVTAIERRDILAMVGLEPPLSGYEFKPEPPGLLTTTRIKARALLEIDPENEEEPVPATIGLEPQSPIIDPKPETLSKLLGLRNEQGPVLGSLATPSGLVKGGALVVRMPYRALLHHVLIVGTTGSGKTTLLKNMIASLYSEWSQNTPIIVAVDMNQDFIQLPLKAERQPSDVVARIAYGNVKPPRSLVIVTPLPQRVVESIYDSMDFSKISELELAEHAAMMYYEESLEPLIGSRLKDLNCIARNSRSIICRATAPWGTLVFVPYVINTTVLESDTLASLMPGLTEAARELLGRIRRGFRKRKEYNLYPPIQAILGALKAYDDGVRSSNRMLVLRSAGEVVISRIVSRGVSDESLMEAVKIDGSNKALGDIIVDVLEVLEQARPHRETPGALYRRIQSLLDTEIVDIPMVTNKLTLLREPQWEDTIVEAETLQAPIVLDLKWPIDKGLGSLEGPRMAAYKMLQSLIQWKHWQWSKRIIGRGVVVIIDEAHQFFPQERGAREEQEASRQVASMISRIARLGRARGVGLIFSTHSPKDLHDIIIQLANTKIILRTEPQHVEKLDVPAEVREFLPRLPDRLMTVISYVFKGGPLFVQTTTPLTAHYDISYHIFGK